MLRYVSHDGAFLCDQKLLSRQQRHVAVRRGLREDSDSEHVTSSSKSSVHYVASQYLNDSSLNADVSQFDFAHSVCLFATSDSLYSLVVAGLSFLKFLFLYFLPSVL